MTEVQFPASAALIEQAKPNANGEGVIQIHAIGCQHQNRVRTELIYGNVFPEDTFLDFGSGVEGAAKYYVALRSGVLDDGVVNQPWIARLAPCAR